MSPSKTYREPSRLRRILPWLGLAGLLFALLLGVDVLRFVPALPEELELRLDLTEAPIGAPEPLVVCGYKEHGDFLYLVRSGLDHFQLGYDSWGAGGPRSLDFSIPADRQVNLRIRMPAMAGQGRAAERPQTLKIWVDGQAWEPRVHSYGAEASTVSVASNFIGGSTCSSEASFQVYGSHGQAMQGHWRGGFLPWRQRLGAWWSGQSIWHFPVIFAVAGLLCLGVFKARNWLRPLGASKTGALLGQFAASRDPALERAGKQGGRDGRTSGDHSVSLQDLPSWFSVLPARVYLLGVIVGFAGCVGLGFLASKENPLRRSFRNFYCPITVQALYYPTASGLVAHVRATVPHDKILVLVGGASYFRGTGQNPGELWTLELQRLLGERYAVVNYAVDQAGPTAFAGAAFQALAKEYPHMVYLSSGSPFTNDPLDGGDIYRYVYWDAYYKGLLQVPEYWRRRQDALRRKELGTEVGEELHLGRWLDSKVWASDLWHWIGYHHVFTVWMHYYPTDFYKPRKSFPDTDGVDYVAQQRANRENKEYYDLYAERFRSFSRNGYDQVGGEWVLNKGTPLAIQGAYDGMFPKELRSRCLIVLLHSNPWFLKDLSAADRQRMLSMGSLSQSLIEDIGYQAVQVGADFSEDDFLDAGHFMASGGRKLAGIVAAKVRSMEP